MASHLSLVLKCVFAGYLLSRGTSKYALVSSKVRIFAFLIHMMPRRWRKFLIVECVFFQISPQTNNLTVYFQFYESW